MSQTVRRIKNIIEKTLTRNSFEYIFLIQSKLNFNLNSEFFSFLWCFKKRDNQRPRCTMTDVTSIKSLKAAFKALRLLIGTSNLSIKLRRNIWQRLEKPTLSVIGLIVRGHASRVQTGFKFCPSWNEMHWAREKLTVSWLIWDFFPPPHRHNDEIDSKFEKPVSVVCNRWIWWKVEILDVNGDLISLECCL